LTKLNEDLHLNIGKQIHFRKTEHTFANPIFTLEPVKISIPKFSFFTAPVSNIIPSKEISLPDVYDLIRSNTYQDITEKLRSHSDPAKARDFKANRFDYVTFSGTFSKRNDKSLLKHSGLITIDFDHIPDISLLKQQLLDDEYFDTELMFVSPSGTGLKWIISIDLTEGTHLDYFKSIAAYILTTYHLEIDKSGKDISRACFLSYDPDAYLNPKYLAS